MDNQQLVDKIDKALESATVCADCGLQNCLTESSSEDAAEVCAKIASEHFADLQAENERLREALQKFTAQPYPDDIFLPVSDDELTAIHQMLMERFNMPIDRLAGHIGRELRKGIIEEAHHALTARQVNL